MFIVICTVHVRVKGPHKILGLGPFKALIRPSPRKFKQKCTSHSHTRPWL